MPLICSVGSLLFVDKTGPLCFNGVKLAVRGIPLLWVIMSYVSNKFYSRIFSALRCNGIILRLYLKIIEKYMFY